MNIDKPIIFGVGVLFGATMMLLANKADLNASDKIIANLEKKANSVPIITVDALGICKVKQGGKSYMLIDVTEELKAFDLAEQPINNKQP